MYDIKKIKNINKIAINDDNGMLSPTTDELTSGGKFNRYQVAFATGRGARMITNEYTVQRTEYDEHYRATTPKDQKDAVPKMMEQRGPSPEVNPIYRDQKAVRVAINKIVDGEYKLVEREDELGDLDADVKKRIDEIKKKYSELKRRMAQGKGYDVDDDELISADDAADADSDEEVEIDDDFIKAIEKALGVTGDDEAEEKAEETEAE